MSEGTPELVNVAEIARRLGLSHSRVHQLAARRDFPRPAAIVGKRRAWRWEDVEAWARRNRH